MPSSPPGRLVDGNGFHETVAYVHTGEQNSYPTKTAAGLATRYRPAKFSDVVGQRHATALLKARLASTEQGPPQQLLLTGGSGLGKTTLSRIVAAAVTCTGTTSPDPCGECESCTTLLSNSNHPDITELDAASHGGKDEIKRLASRAQVLPLIGARRVFIIDEAHGISKQGAEAALKLLEEPPAHVTFILATTDPDKMLPTILGRCLTVELLSPTRQELEQHVESVVRKEGHNNPPKWLASTIVQGTPSDLGVRGILQNVEKILPTLESETEDSVAARLGVIPQSALDRVYRYVTNGLRLEAFAGINDLREQFSETTIRDALVTKAHEALVHRVSTEEPAELAGWRLETLVDCPPGMVWTDLAVTRLTTPTLMAERTLFGRPAQWDPIHAAALDAAVASLESVSSGNASPQEPPVEEPPAEEPPAEEPPAEEPPAEEPPAEEPPAEEPPAEEPPAEEPPAEELDAWFDNPAASNTSYGPNGRPSEAANPQRSGKTVSGKAPSTSKKAAKPKGTTKATKSKGVTKATKPKGNKTPPLQTKVPARTGSKGRRVANTATAEPTVPDALALWAGVPRRDAEALYKLIDASNPKVAQILRGCTLSVPKQATLQIVVPDSRVKAAKADGFRGTVVAAAEGVGYSDVVFLRHRG